MTEGKNRIMIFGPRSDGTMRSSSEPPSVRRWPSRSRKVRPQCCNTFESGCLVVVCP
jgi:hypothetical protein